MQFEALKLFCDVARCRSFSQAAAANGLSQSAASQVVLMLERRLGGVQLIDRATRPLQLTTLGKAYYEGCKGLVEQYLELEASIRQSQAEIDATVQVAAIYSVGIGNMSQVVARFEAENPGTRVHVEYLHPDKVYERVLNGTADLGLVSFPRRSRELISIPWREEPMVLVCAPAHPLARLRSVKPEQIAGACFIAFDKDLVIRRQVDRFLREQGVAVDVAMEFDNIENIKKAIEISDGVALLPEPRLQREVQVGTLVAVPLHGCRLVRPLGILYGRHHRLNTTILRLIDLLREEEPPLHSVHAAGNGQANGVRRSGRHNGLSRRAPRRIQGKA
jgi:DNA-binding transcriptional LysR family regulator